ncbi:hypothetical protein GALL_401500 [mine drainage metagenome]|uniref:Cytidine deaminase n=1 Tax=mine drainage metagenome TaxID=410659 RepID=A0A1J5Q490_9ZZZZ
MTVNLEGFSEEDQKLFTLARATKVRNNVAQSAAVRDITGRTYTATLVALEALNLDALQSVVAAAISSGAIGLEAAVVVGHAPSQVARIALFEFAGAIPLWHEDEIGRVGLVN